jgi:hypothetical protein
MILSRTNIAPFINRATGRAWGTLTLIARRVCNTALLASHRIVCGTYQAGVLPRLVRANAPTNFGNFWSWREGAAASARTALLSHCLDAVRRLVPSDLRQTAVGSINRSLFRDKPDDLSHSFNKDSGSARRSGSIFGGERQEQPTNPAGIGEETLGRSARRQNFLDRLPDFLHSPLRRNYPFRLYTGRRIGDFMVFRVLRVRSRYALSNGDCLHLPA